MSDLVFVIPPTVTSVTANSYRISGELAEEGDVFAVAILPEATDPTEPNQIISGIDGAGTNARGIGSQLNTMSFSFDITGANLGDNPTHNIFIVGRTTALSIAGVFAQDLAGFYINIDSPKYQEIEEPLSTSAINFNDPIGTFIDSSGNAVKITAIGTNQRPFIARQPVNGVRNLLRNTEIWTAGGTSDNISYVALIALEGQTFRNNQVFQIIPPSGFGQSSGYLVYRSSPITSVGQKAGDVYCQSMFIKPLGSVDRFTTTVMDGDCQPSGHRGATFTFSTVNCSGPTRGSIVAVEDGWYYIQYSRAVATPNCSIQNRLNVLTADTALWDGTTNGYLIAGWQLERVDAEGSNVATAYQKVGTTFQDVFEEGATNRYFIGLDGIDDNLTADFTDIGPFYGTLLVGTPYGVIHLEVNVPNGPYQFFTAVQANGNRFGGVNGVVLAQGTPKVSGMRSQLRFDPAKPDFERIGSIAGMFKNRSDIVKIYMNTWETSTCRSFAEFAMNCTSLTDVIIHGGVADPFLVTSNTNFTNAFTNTNLTQESIDNILVSLVGANRVNGTFNQSGGSAPSAIGHSAVDLLRNRGWTVTVQGGY
jgi:hypothetical protein